MEGAVHVWMQSLGPGTHALPLHLNPQLHWVRFRSALARNSYPPAVVARPRQYS